MRGMTKTGMVNAGWFTRWQCNAMKSLTCLDWKLLLCMTLTTKEFLVGFPPVVSAADEAGIEMSYEALAVTSRLAQEGAVSFPAA